MTTRINQSDLYAVVNRINRATGNAQEPTRKEDIGVSWNVGTYMIDMAYGGYKLVRIENEAGGIRSITSGYIPKRELYYHMQAFLAGVEASKS